MYELLSFLESSILGETIRGMGVWAYGILNLCHILGVATLFGSMMVLDLRLIGVWRNSVDLRSVVRPTVPLAGGGFLLAVLSGVCMISVNATEYEGNPFFFYVKLPAIGLALLNVIALQFVPAWKAILVRDLTPAEQRQLTIGGAVSLLCWLVAVSGGRMIGYY